MRFTNIWAPLSRHSGSADLASPVVRTVIAATVGINLLVLAVPLYINRIYTSVLPQKAGDSLVVITLLLLAVLVVDVLLKVGRAAVLSWLAAAQEHRLRLDAIRSLLAAPLEASEAAPIDDRLEQVRAASQLRSVFEQQWLVRHIDVPFALVYLLVLALIGGWLVLIPVGLIPLFLWQGGLASTRMAAALQRKSRSESFRNAVVLACLQAASTVKSLNLEGFLVRRLDPAQEAFSQSVVDQESSAARLQNLSQLFAQWSQLLIVTFGGWMVIHQDLSSGALAACTLLSGQVTMPLSKLFSAEAQQASLQLAESQYRALAELEPEASFLSGESVPEAGELRIGILTLVPGSKALLIGGKPHQSTAFLESLTGLTGSIPADLQFAGRYPHRMERTALRQRLRLVRSGAPMLRGSLLENLTQFRNDQLANQATALCNRHGVAGQILNLPRGFDTPIGESQDFPLAAGLAFRLQVMQALLDAPAVLLVDASEVALSSEQLAWLLDLDLEASCLVALPSIPASRSLMAISHYGWHGQQLIEVQP